MDTNNEVGKETDMGMCTKGVGTCHNEDGMEVDGSTGTIGGGAAGDAGRCDGRGGEVEHTLSRRMSILAITQKIQSAPYAPCHVARRLLGRGVPLAQLGPKAACLFAQRSHWS